MGGLSVKSKKKNWVGAGEYSETYLDGTPLCSVQSVQSKKVFILRVTTKIDVLLGFVKEPIDCQSLGRLHSMFYEMLSHLWQQWNDFIQLLSYCKIRKNLKCF